MYYEEKVIDGILHHHSDPNDPFSEWIPFTLVELTSHYINQKNKLFRLEEKIENLEELLDRSDPNIWQDDYDEEEHDPEYGWGC